MNVDHFRQYIVDPVCKQLDLYSPAASNLLVGTALQESRLHYLVQMNGPALGVFQMEPETFDDIFNNFLNFNVELRKKVIGYAFSPLLSKEIIGNLYLATAMARVHYYRVKEALPDANDHMALAQ